MSGLTEVIVRDVSSGRFHKRFRTEGSDELASFEGCNADSAGAYVIVAEGELDGDATARDGSFCRRCFPKRDRG